MMAGGSMNRAQGLSPDDLRLLDRLQVGLPVAPDPYETIGRELGLSGDEVFARVRALRQAGVIRRLGAVLDPGAMGYVSTLAAAAVPESLVERAAEVIGRCGNITHNYLRKAVAPDGSPASVPWGMWFTVTAISTERIRAILEEIAREAGISAPVSLPSTRRFKVEVRFAVAGEASPGGRGSEHASVSAGPQPANGGREQPTAEACGRQPAFPDGGRQLASGSSHAEPALAMDDLARSVIRTLASDVPMVRHPYEKMAAQAGLDVSAYLEAVAGLIRARVVRRFCATLAHYAVGYEANAMTVWRVPENRVEAAGPKMAKSPAVSHCYARATVPGWDYNLYTMIHGKSEEECFAHARALAEEAEVEDYLLLFTVRELKKIRFGFDVE